MHSDTDSSRSGQSQMPATVKIAVAAYLAVLPVALLVAIVRLWPSSGDAFATEMRCLVMAALAGALGTCIHLASSFVKYAGNRNLQSSWAWWYFLRPGIGAALAEVVYFALRAGLVSGAGNVASAAINPYGVAGIAALSGMFSNQATEKLRQLFENVCATGMAPHDDPASDK